MLKYIQKHKQKLLKYTKPILLGFSLISLLLTAEPTYAIAPLIHVGLWILGIAGVSTATFFGIKSLGGFGEAFVKLMVDIVKMIVGVLLDVLVPIILTVYENVLAYPDYLLNLDITTQTWSLILAVANGFFLLALLIASIAIILRINTGVYNIKKFLGGFIAAVVLSNLSLLIVRALVGIGNMLYSIIKTSFNIDGVIGQLTGPVEIPSALSDNLIPAVFMLIFTILIFFIILKITLILVERMLWIFMLALVAPIAFALGLLPVTQKLISQWWEALIKWILVLPLTFGLISLGIIVMTSGSGDVDNIMDNFLSFNKDSLDPGKILPIVGGFIILYLAGTAGKMLKVGGALSGIVGDNALQGIGKLGKLYKGVVDTATGKSWAGKQLHRRGQDIYNIGMASKTLRGLEAKRRTLKGPLGRILNPTRERGRIEFEREKGAEGIHPQEIGIRLNNVQKNQTSLDKIVAQMYGAEKDWDSLGDIEQSNLKDSNRTVKNLLKNIGADQGAANKFMQDASPKVTELDPASVLEITAQNPKKNIGERAIAIHGIRSIARNQGRPDRYQAREWLNDNKEAIKNVGLDPRKYESRKAGGGEEFNSDIQLINAREQQNRIAKKKTDILTKLSGLGLNQKMAQKIGEEGIPYETRNIRGVKIETLNALESKNLSINNMTRKRTIEAIAGEDTNETKLVTDMINSGISIKDMKIFKNIDTAKIKSTDIQDSLEELSSIETSQQQLKQTIEKIENIQYNETIDVKRILKRNVTPERQLVLHDIAKTQFNKLSTLIENDPSIKDLGESGLSLQEQNDIHQSIIETKTELGLPKDASKILVGDALAKLRKIRDAFAKEDQENK